MGTGLAGRSAFTRVGFWNRSAEDCNSTSARLYCVEQWLGKTLTGA
jgi:hypothetical protein